MLGIQFVKVDPTQYVLQFRKGQVVKEGLGLSFLYFAPTTSVVAVPMAAFDEGFMFEHVTRDFQAVTVQGQVVFRVKEPKKTAALLNFTLAADGRRYASDDAAQLPARVVRAVEVLSQQAVKGWPLKEALLATDRLATLVATGLAQSAEITSLGLEVLGVSVVAIRPTPETAKALAADAREAILKAADDAIYARRNAAVEAEREIRESELETEIAVEKKSRTVRETKMDAEAAIREREQALRQKQMEADIALEDTRTAFVETNAANTRVLAEAEAHRVGGGHGGAEEHRSARRAGARGRGDAAGAADRAGVRRHRRARGADRAVERVARAARRAADRRATRVAGRVHRRRGERSCCPPVSARSCS